LQAPEIQGVGEDEGGRCRGREGRKGGRERAPQKNGREA
jgi:hypothetical protein